MSPSPDVPKQIGVTLRSVRPSRTLFMPPSAHRDPPPSGQAASLRPRRSARKAWSCGLSVARKAEMRRERIIGGLVEAIGVGHVCDEAASSIIRMLDGAANGQETACGRTDGRPTRQGPETRGRRRRRSARNQVRYAPQCGAGRRWTCSLEWPLAGHYGASRRARIHQRAEGAQRHRADDRPEAPL